jgi:alpha-galactosidase
MMYEGNDATPRTADRERIRAWTDHLLGDPSQLPVSFQYGGRPVRGIPPEWSPTSSLRPGNPMVEDQVYESHDPRTGLELRVEITRYNDYPVVEWTAWLTNRSERPSPLIEDLVGLDATFAGRGCQVRHCNGDFNSGDGFAWETRALEEQGSLEVASTGGRPCDGAFPYFRLLYGDGGMTLAVGWPGQWRARFGLEEGAVSVVAGQERTRMRLMPGEAVRTPRLTLMGWEGDETRGINLWRRWYREHILPRPGGERLTPLLAVTGTDEGEEFTGATEANQLEYQRRYVSRGIRYDIWWIDAGWYPCADESGTRRWTITGTWRPDPERFPNGLAAVGEGATEHGAKLLLWFEPERVAPGTELYEGHANWLLHRPSTEPDGQRRTPRELSGLLDLSKAECRAWITELVSGMITSCRIGIYRQDFNFAPLEFWRADDAADRQGLKENLHVQGYLAFWDALLERHPNLLIDSCASGGRRNDLETMRRSVPLHYTDYGYGQHATKLDFHRTMYEWLPYFKESNQSWDLEEATEAGIEATHGDAFSFHCALAPMLQLAYDIRSPDQGLSGMVNMVSTWRTAAEIVLGGDYYPLTPPGRSDKDWVALQFDRPLGLVDQAEVCGFVQAVRLRECEQSSLQVRLKALRPESTYVLEEAETGERREMAGAALLNEGITVTLPRRSGSIWWYREQPT